MKKFFTISTFIMSMFLFFNVSTAKADTFGGGRSNSNRNIMVYLDSSVANSSYYNSIYSYARSYWSNTGTSFSGFLVASSNSPTSDEYCVSTTATSGLLGRTYPYKRVNGSSVTATNNEYWEWCKIFIYSNQMDAYSMTDDQRRSNAAHEIGHSLKLAHTTANTSSVMLQGIQSIQPTSYDIGQLRSKWNSI